MTATLQDSDFKKLPIRPENGFPQAFLLSFEGKLYHFTFSVSFLTLEPFKMWEAGSGPPAETTLRRSLNLPLSVSGARVPLLWELQDGPERMIYVLPQAELYLVMKVEREDMPADRRLQSITRPVLDIPTRVGDLVFLFKKIHIARGNLLWPGSFGSEIIAGVTTYGG